MEIYLFVVLTSLAAFFIKGITGIGVTTMVVGFGSFFLEPKITIILSSFITIFGNLAMLKIDPVSLKRQYWLSIAIMMIIGSIIGAYILTIIDAVVFRKILGVTFFLASLSFFVSKPSVKTQAATPERASSADFLFGWIGGFCGGFVGVNAPPLIYHFGKALNKSQLRRLLVIILLPAGVAQTATFAYTGVLTKQIMLYGLAMIPFMFLGIYLGNKVHFKISEKWFRRILGTFIMFVSLKLLLT